MLKHLLQVSLLGLALSGCTFHRLRSNAVYRDLDPTGISAGVSTWRDVLNELGLPSGSTTEKVSAGLDMATFRYACGISSTSRKSFGDGGL